MGKNKTSAGGGAPVSLNFRDDEYADLRAAVWEHIFLFEQDRLMSLVRERGNPSPKKPDPVFAEILGQQCQLQEQYYRYVDADGFEFRISERPELPADQISSWVVVGSGEGIETAWTSDIYRDDLYASGYCYCPCKPHGDGWVILNSEKDRATEWYRYVKPGRHDWVPSKVSSKSKLPKLRTWKWTLFLHVDDNGNERWSAEPFEGDKHLHVEVWSAGQGKRIEATFTFNVIERLPPGNIWDLHRIRPRGERWQLLLAGDRSTVWWRARV